MIGEGTSPGDVRLEVSLRLSPEQRAWFLAELDLWEETARDDSDARYLSAARSIRREAEGELGGRLVGRTEAPMRLTPEEWGYLLAELGVSEDMALVWLGAPSETERSAFAIQTAKTIRGQVEGQLGRPLAATFEEVWQQRAQEWIDRGGGREGED